VRIDPLATGGKEDGLKYFTGGEFPMAHLKPNEYYPGITGLEPRKDLKPLNIVQPDGPSFTVTDNNLVSWQKWRFRVGFNYREGMIVHDVRYDGRPVFYRLSVSEMTVPYGGKFDSPHTICFKNVLVMLDVVLNFCIANSNRSPKPIPQKTGI